MARICAWLAAGALMLIVMPIRAEERVTAMAAGATPAVESPQAGCSSDKCGHGRVRHVLKWMTYRSSDRSGLCGCYYGQCASSWTPPLSTVFPCDGEGPFAAP